MACKFTFLHFLDLDMKVKIESNDNICTHHDPKVFAAVPSGNLLPFKDGIQLLELRAGSLPSRDVSESFSPAAPLPYLICLPVNPMLFSSWN